MRLFILGIAAATLAACADSPPVAGGPPPSTVASAAPATGASVGPSTASTPAEPVASPSASASASASAKPVASDLSRLKRLGIDLGEGVLIDVADDGQARYLQVGRGGVDFTGTTRTDSTMMALKAAPVRQRNRVLIKPPFWNEDLGAGSCVADTPGAALKLETCVPGRAAQVWEVRPAGDSGQFELYGIHGVIRVDQGKITTGGAGRTGLQTVPFRG